MHDLSRRAFIKNTALGASALVAGCSSIQSFGKASATDRVKLGATGVSLPRVAMGTGTRGWKKVSDQTKLGKEGFSRLIAHGVDHGLAFIDSADLYGSHEYVRYALKTEKIPRDKVTILSKIWFAEAPEMTPTSTAKPELDRFRKELGVDMIDICLIHCVTAPDWPSQLERMRDELSELKEKGVVRAVGCSCHTHAALKEAIDNPWVDVVLARINYDHKRMDDDATTDETAQTLKRARAKGKGVLGMKIFGCGDLTNPEQRNASLQYVLGNELVDAMTIGFTSPEQIDDATANIDRVLQA